MTRRPGGPQPFDDAESRVDLIERAPRTAKVIRRRRVAGAGVAAAALAALAVTSWSGKPSPRVTPSLATPVTLAPQAAGTPSTSPQAAAAVAAEPGTTVRNKPRRTAVTAPQHGPAAWRIAYRLSETDGGAEVRDGAGRLVHTFPAADPHLDGSTLDLVTLTPDGRTLVYTLVSDGFSTLHARRSDGSADSALDDAQVGPTTCECEQQVLGGWQRDITEIEASADDRHVAASDQYGLSVVTIGSKAQRTVVTLADGLPKEDDGAGVSLARWSPDGRRLAFVTGATRVRPEGSSSGALGQDSLYVWDMATGAVTLVDHGSTPTAVAWSPSGELAWLTLKGTVNVRSTTGTRTVARAPQFNAGQENGTLSWSPDGRRLAVSTDLLRLVMVSTGASGVVPQRGPDSKVVWLPDGTLLVSGFNARNVPPDTVLGGPMVFDQAGHLLRQFPWGRTDPYWDFSFGSPAR